MPGHGSFPGATLWAGPGTLECSSASPGLCWGHLNLNPESSTRAQGCGISAGWETLHGHITEVLGSGLKQHLGTTSAEPPGARVALTPVCTQSLQRKWHEKSNWERDR